LHGARYNYLRPALSRARRPLIVRYGNDNPGPLLAWWGYNRSVAKPIIVTLAFWSVTGSLLVALDLYWQTGGFSLIEAGTLLTTLINGVTNSLLGHFMFIAANMLWLNNHLSQRSRIVGQQLEQFLDSHIHVINTMSKAVQDSSDYSSQRLADLAEAYPSFLTFLLTNTLGLITQSHPQSLYNKAAEAQQLDISQRKYFQHPKQTKGPYISSAFRGKGFGNDPIVAITANAYAEDRQFCLDAGMNEHISKPVDKTALIRVLFSLVDS
jgi:hypothetical protein